MSYVFYLRIFAYLYLYCIKLRELGRSIFELVLSFLSTMPIMPQSRGFFWHLRPSQGNHPTCLNFSNCFRGKTCGFCESWSSVTWRKFEKRRSYHTKYAKKKESSARKQTAFKKRPMKTPEFVESDSGEWVVQEVIDSSESRLNYRDGASGSFEELSAKSGVLVESRTHPRVDQADSPPRGQKVRHWSGSI